MNAQIEATFRTVQPDVDFCSLRLVHSRAEQLEVRQGVLQPIQRADDRGAMLTVHHKGGIGYAATADLSEAGLRDALGRAEYWAGKTAGRAVTDFSALPMPEPSGVYTSEVGQSWDSVSLADRLDLLLTQGTLKFHRRHPPVNIGGGNPLVDLAASSFSWSDDWQAIPSRGKHTGRNIQSQLSLTDCLVRAVTGKAVGSKYRQHIPAELNLASGPASRYGTGKQPAAGNR